MKQAHTLLCLLAAASLATPPAVAAKPQPAGKRTAKYAPASAGGVYPQYKFQGRSACRWIPQQMPFNVWIANGLSLDKLNDPASGAPVTNTANTAGWGDCVMQLVRGGQLSILPVAEGYSEDQRQAAERGILSWKTLEKEGLYSYNLTDNPDDADVYIFWTHHFVNKLGLGLFENDIRGLTSKHLLPIQPVEAALQRNDIDFVARSRKPVVILLRTTQQDGSAVSPARMQAYAAHEMGHALGIDGHSPNPTDLMSVYYGKGVASGNDLATMRHLYRQPADMIP